MGVNRFKNTDSGPLHINNYVGVSAGIITSGTSVQSFNSADFITSARFILLNVLSADKDVLVEVGSPTAIDPNQGSIRMGRVSNIKFLQLPYDGSTSGVEVKIKEDAYTGAAAVYTLHFVD